MSRHTQHSAAVDWRLVDQELSQVPQEFKDPKFYALKHVVEILTAEDPRELVGQVRQRATFVYAHVLLLMFQFHVSGPGLVQPAAEQLHVAMQPHTQFAFQQQMAGSSLLRALPHA